MKVVVVKLEQTAEVEVLDQEMELVQVNGRGIKRRWSRVKRGRT